MEHWRTGIIIALCLHLAVLIMAIVGPDLIKSHRKKEEIYTVKLFEPVKQPVKKFESPAPKPAPAPSPPPVPKSRPIKPPAVTKPVQPSPIKKVRKAVEKKPQSKPKPLKKARPAPEAKAAKKAVSLKPEKKKQVSKPAQKPKEKPQPPSREELLKKRIAAIKQQVKEKEEEKKLQERLNALSRKLKERKKIAERPGVSPGDAAVSGTGKAESINEIIVRYGMEVSQRVWRRWNLPTQLIDQKGLEAIIEIRIADDGRIIAREFERASGNMLFDQSAMRAVKDASPVPPLPPQLRPGPLVMGIRFRPEGM